MMTQYTNQTAVLPYAATRAFDRPFRPAERSSAVPEMTSGARSVFNTLGSVAALNLLGGIAVAVAASYTGAFEGMLTLVFGMEVTIALVCFVVALKWVRE